MFDCVIAAGGRASRHGGARPKSLIRTSLGISWLTITVRECLGAGFKKILIAQNRLEWIDETRNILVETGFADSCEIHRDEGYSSSVLLLGSLRHLLESRMLFIYGHAPRQRSHLTKLRSALTECAAAFTGVTSSTRHDPTRIGDVYLEPPVGLDVERIDVEALSNWAEVWDAAATAGKACVVNTPGPGEFNTSAESKEFETQVLPRILSDSSQYR